MQKTTRVVLGVLAAAALGLGVPAVGSAAEPGPDAVKPLLLSAQEAADAIEYPDQLMQMGKSYCETKKGRTYCDSLFRGPVRGIPFPSRIAIEAWPSEVAATASVAAVQKKPGKGWKVIAKEDGFVSAFNKKSNELNWPAVRVSVVSGSYVVEVECATTKKKAKTTSIEQCARQVMFVQSAKLQ